MLAHGTEVVTPTEVGMTLLRLKYFNPVLNKEKMRMNLDQINEFRDEALDDFISQKQQVARYYNKKVCS